jgi:hypothetical protein
MPVQALDELGEVDRGEPARKRRTTISAALVADPALRLPVPERLAYRNVDIPSDAIA